MIPLTPCVPALVTVSICPETQVSGDEGPRNSASSTWSSRAASLAPSFACSKTAMPVCLGMKTDLNSCPGSNVATPPASPPLVSAAPPESAGASSSSSSPQPAAASINATIKAARIHAMPRQPPSNRLFLSDPSGFIDLSSVSTLRWVQIRMPSRGITSLVLAARGGRSSLFGSRRAPRAGEPGDEVRDENGEDQQTADDAGLRVLVDVREAEAVADVEDDQDRQRDADDRSGSSEDAHPAEEDHRDDVELEAECEVSAYRAEPRREEDPRQAREEARRGHDDHLVARDVDARVAGHVRVVADHEQGPAECRAVKDDPCHDDQHEEEDQCEREAPDQG